MPINTITISGQISNGAGANQLVTAAPYAWPITNAAGSSATDPGIVQALCDASGNWTVDVTAIGFAAHVLITTPQGTSDGNLPSSFGAYTLSSLQSGSGWSANGAA